MSTASFGQTATCRTTAAANSRRNSSEAAGCRLGCFFLFKGSRGTSMENAVRNLVDRPMITAASAFRRLAFHEWRVHPLALEHRVQRWFRAMVGLSACFLASRFTAEALPLAGVFFMWIVGVFVLSHYATKAVPSTWRDGDWRDAMADSARRRADDLLQRLCALGMIGVSLAMVVLLCVVRDATGVAIAFGMLGLALAEACRCYIRAADPPAPL